MGIHGLKKLSPFRILGIQHNGYIGKLLCQVKCNKIMNVFFLACRMNAQLLKIYWCDIQSLGFDCLIIFFRISYTLYNAFYELFFFQSSIIMNYLFNDIISSDRNNTEDEKKSNNSQCLFPLFLSHCNWFPVERTSDRRQFAMTGTLQ